jgi:hypothetical protein
MTGRDDLLRDALTQMADGAVVPDHMGERALRGAARRRYRSIAGGAVGAVVAVAAVITVPTAVLGHGEHRTVADTQSPGSFVPWHGAIPSNTPAELAIVKECMVGPPNVSKTPTSIHSRSADNLTGPGTATSSFRVLVTRRDGNGTAVLLGSVTAERTCDLDRSGRASESDRRPNESANTWQPPLTAPLNGQIEVQDDDGGVMQDKNGPTPVSKWTDADHLLGRVSSRVARLTVTERNGVTTTAGIDHGFFVWRAIRSALLNQDTTEPITMRAYDSTGHLLQTYHPGPPA